MYFMSNELANNDSGELGDFLRKFLEMYDDDRKSQSNSIANVEQKVDDVATTVDDVVTTIGVIKESQYLEPWQAAKVQEAAKLRVFDLLKEYCEDNGEDIDIICHRYFGKFVRAIHNDAKKAGLEIGKIIYTPKKNYELLLEFIGKWYPTRGVKGQMEHYDKLASDR